ncbi:MAG: hypothetical protein PWQ89_1518 [Verrucomicrobiota bacterium]|nr:hypothetical protein [Verrucomicrobiota bacterium]
MRVSIILYLISLTLNSFGEVMVNWSASGGFYFNEDSSVGILGDSTGNSTIAQLIYSVDENVDDALINGSTSGDDIVWDTIILTEDGIANDTVTYDSYAVFSSDYQQEDFSAGYIYARIFQDNDINTGDWYYYTMPIALTDITSPTPPQSLEMNTDTEYGDPIDFGPTVAQVVPEPATLLLVGTGGISVWLVHRRKLETKT